MLKSTVLGFMTVAFAAVVASTARADETPLTISVSTVGNFAEGNSWHLSVNSAGQAELTIDTSPKPTRKQFQVSKAQWAEFRKALADGRFFELKADYGDLVPGGSERSVTVTAGRHAHTVKVNYLMNWANRDKPKVREPSRAVRLLVLVRSWFDEAEAVDLRRYDQKVLDAAKE